MAQEQSTKSGATRTVSKHEWRYGRMGQRATQTRSGSALEAVTNVAVGFLLAFVMQGVIYPALSIVTTPQTNLLIAAIFTLVSVVRSYLVRRAFEQIAWR